jgi:hypothetical protein
MMPISRPHFAIGWIASTVLALLATAPVLGQSLDLRPLDFSQVLTRIALGSCARQGRPQPIWEAVVDSDPDVFILSRRQHLRRFRGDACAKEQVRAACG